MALTATWSDPVTGIGADGFESFTKLPAAAANQYILQNLLWLFDDGKTHYAAATANQTTTSGTPADVTGCSITRVCAGEAILITAAGTLQPAGPDSSIAGVSLYKDGAPVGKPVFAWLHDTTAAAVPFTVQFAEAPAAGSHTYTLRFWRSSGSGTPAILGATGSGATITIARV